MTKFARMTDADIAGDRLVIDLIEGDPEEQFHPDIAVEFIEVPAETSRWSTKNGQMWTHSEEPTSVVPAPDPVPVSLIYPRFLGLIRQAGGLTADVALSIVDGTHASAEVRFLRALLLEATGPLERDDPLVQGGLDVLVSESVLTATGRATIMAAWPVE